MFSSGILNFSSILNFGNSVLSWTLKDLQTKEAVAAAANKNTGQLRVPKAVLGAALKKAGSGKDCSTCKFRRPSSEFTNGSPSLFRTNILICFEYSNWIFRCAPGKITCNSCLTEKKRFYLEKLEKKSLVKHWDNNPLLEFWKKFGDWKFLIAKIRQLGNELIAIYNCILASGCLH